MFRNDSHKSITHSFFPSDRSFLANVRSFSNDNSILFWYLCSWSLCFFNSWKNVKDKCLGIFFNFTYFFLFFIEFLTKTALSWSFIRLGDFFSFPNKFPIIFVKDVRNISLMKINWIHLIWHLLFVSLAASADFVSVSRLARKFKIYTAHCAPPRPHHLSIFWWFQKVRNSENAFDYLLP